MEVYLILMLNTIKSLFFKLSYYIIFLSISSQVHGDNHYPENKTYSIQWEYLPSFKERHNITFFIGGGKSFWTRKSHGSSEKKYTGVLYGTKVSYAYHMLLYKKLGCLLGTSLAYWLEDSNSPNVFEPNYRLELPGFVFGIVYHTNPRARFIVKLGAHFERYPKITLYDSSGDKKDISISMSTWRDFSFGVDYFLNFNWALHLAVQFKSATFQKPLNTTLGSVLDMDLVRQDTSVGLGLVYTIL